MFIPQNIIISRTDAIGDVMLTLPLAGILKERFPGVKIAFLGRRYTKAVIETCSHVDQFIDLDDFMGNDITIDGKKTEVIIHVFPVAAIAARARKLGIRYRIGTTNRLWHWYTCNRLVSLSRRKSALHESQLNAKLLGPLGIKDIFTTKQLAAYAGFTVVKPLPQKFAALLQPGKYHLIIHPKSQGSAREWGIDHIITLVRLLDKEKIQILISGTEKEKALMQPLFDATAGQVTDITGMMNLHEFISFIAYSDGLMANSTGPAHIAAALGKDVFATYPPIRPMHPGRWQPLGRMVQVFVLDKDCEACRKTPEHCSCIKAIQPVAIQYAIENAANQLIAG